jgi:hypothetical protein
MKKVLLATLLIGMVSGCEEPTVQKKTTPVVIKFGDKPLDIVTIEGCEYLISYYDRSRSITHKGNCSNPIHKGGKK